MLEYDQAEQAEMPETGNFSVKIIGVGGAGANVLDRMTLNGTEDADMLTLNTDVRALSTSVSNNKIQLGKDLLKGMGAGGDPELGRQAALEVEDQIREAVRGHNMVFVCAGLGGGTGSGAAPEVCRIANEEGVFLVAFTTLPFTFEGARRMQQAKDALGRIGEHANAVVTFENDRMGSLTLDKDGIQSAFQAADDTISESVRATTNIVTQPGIIRIGMDDLLSALRNRDSRCLFGHGQAKGDNRALEALKNALKSPLIDKGKLLEQTRNVLVHVSGGDNLTLFEVDLLMKELNKHVGDATQLMFGVGTDKKLGSSLAVTIITSLSEEPAEIAESTPDQDDPEKKKIALRPEESESASSEAAADDVDDASVAEDQELSPESEAEPQPDGSTAAAAAAVISSAGPSALAAAGGSVVADEAIVDETARDDGGEQVDAEAEEEVVAESDPEEAPEAEEAEKADEEGEAEIEAADDEAEVSEDPEAGGESDATGDDSAAEAEESEAAKVEAESGVTDDGGAVEAEAEAETDADAAPEAPEEISGEQEETEENVEAEISSEDDAEKTDEGTAVAENEESDEADAAVVEEPKAEEGADEVGTGEEEQLPVAEEEGTIEENSDSKADDDTAVVEDAEAKPDSEPDPEPEPEPEAVAEARARARARAAASGGGSSCRVVAGTCARDRGQRRWRGSGREFIRGRRNASGCATRSRFRGAGSC